MDPEIQRALADGHSPMEIAAELQRRNLPVPDELIKLGQQNGLTTPAPGPSSVVPPALGLGAAAAGTLGGAGYAANQAFNPKVRARRFLGQAVQESGGPQTLQDVLQQFQDVGKGNLVTLGDLTKRMGAVTDFIATNNPSARAKLSDINDARQRAVPKRVAADAEATMAGGYQAPNYLKDLAATSKSDFAKSDIGYEGLRQRNPVINPAGAGDLTAFVQSPQLRKVWQQAHEVGTIGPMPPTDRLSFETLQDMKERMDDAVGHAFASGRGPLGARLAAARDDLVSGMAKGFPDYAPVSATYHQLSKKEEMLQAGQDAWKSQMQIPDLQQTWQQLSPQDQQAFRQGMGGAVYQDIENSKSNVNLARQLLASSPATEKKLELVFGSPANFQAFTKRMALEKQMGLLTDAIGGASTARRLGQTSDIADQVIEGGSALAHPAASVASAVKNAPKYLAGPVAKQLEPLFTEQGYTRLMRILQSLPK